jgi:energy-coupling factor transporter ATP-binding protein EcfA2
VLGPANAIFCKWGLTKEFKGFVAVNNVDLKVRRGDIHALIGPNGAGKTTFFNLLTKFLPPTRGTITYQGTDITQRAAGADGAPRHRALVPDLGRVPAHDRAGERARGAAAQPGHLLPLLEAEKLAVPPARPRPQLLAERSTCRTSPTNSPSTCPTAASARWSWPPPWRWSPT